MIERHVSFDVHEGKGPHFEAFLHEKYLPAMRAQPGFESAHLLQEQERPNRYELVLRFASLEEAAAWRASQVHRELSPTLKSFYSSSQVCVFRVIPFPG